MFWSKIWLFLVTLVALIAMTIALVLPRPAQRQRVQEERQRLVVACDVVNILLADNARLRLEVAEKYSRSPEIVGALEAASAAADIDEVHSRQARDVGGRLLAQIEGARPDFALLIDRRGRVLARIGLDENDFGDTLAGRPLVDDALDGYLRDDTWVEKGRLYLVTAVPVVRRDAPVAYEGAVVLGSAVTKSFADSLVKSLDANLGFYLNADEVASSTDAVLDRDALAKALPHTGEIAQDCKANPPFNLTASKASYTAVVARLPGEASHKGAYFTVFITQPAAVGFSGTLGAVRQDDLSFKNFPWILVGLALVLALGVGVFLMIWESDRPLKRLAADAVRLAKGERERLGEDEHNGKFGSIARSVNIQIDKLVRDAKAAKKDLDQLLGPAPEGSLGALDLVATPLPAARPGGAAPSFAPPPPSEFRFGDVPAAPRGPASSAPAELDLSGPGPSPSSISRAPARPAAPPPVAAPPPPVVAKPPPPKPAIPAAAPPPRIKAIDDDVLAVDVAGAGETTSVGAEPDSSAEETYFRTVYDQFVELKKKCGESVAGLTYQKFADKLRKNRDELAAKTGNRSVKFTVYVKDGKAALKATPVKEA